MFSESRNDWRPRCCRLPQGLGRPRNRNNSAEIGDDAAGIVGIVAKVIPC